MKATRETNFARYVSLKICSNMLTAKESNKKKRKNKPQGRKPLRDKVKGN